MANLLHCTPNPMVCGGKLAVIAYYHLFDRESQQYHNGLNHFISTGHGGCDGATVELAYEYIADSTSSNSGGMYKISDLAPYDEKDSACSQGNASPVVGIDGWTSLPNNNYLYYGNECFG